jgi:hypothetical protein
VREVEGLVMRRGGGGRRDQDGVLARDGEELVCRQIAVDVWGCWLCGGSLVLKGTGSGSSTKARWHSTGRKDVRRRRSDKYDMTETKGGEIVCWSGRCSR